jgi:hypothetical protein
MAILEFLPLISSEEFHQLNILDLFSAGIQGHLQATSDVVRRRGMVFFTLNRLTDVACWRKALFVYIS